MDKLFFIEFETIRAIIGIILIVVLALYFTYRHLKRLPIYPSDEIGNEVEDKMYKKYLSADDPCPDCGALRNEDGYCLCNDQ